MNKPKVIRGRLHTGGKTVEEIKARYTGQGLTYRGFESLQRAFDLFDGQEINLFKKEGNGETVYYVAMWPKENMKFMLDWLQGKYSAGMAFAFLPEDVEELGVLREEINEPDAPQQKETALPKWRRIRDKRKRRRKA